LKIIAAIEDRPVIVRSLAIWAYRPVPHRVRRRVESIYSKRSEEQKTACQPKPTAPLALSSSERRHKAPLAHTSRLLSGRADRHNSGFFIKQKKEIDISAGRAIWLGLRKGRLKFLFGSIGGSMADPRDMGRFVSEFGFPRAVVMTIGLESARTAREWCRRASARQRFVVFMARARLKGCHP
jgi:hypothetical protein